MDTHQPSHRVEPEAILGRDAAKKTFRQHVEQLIPALEQFCFQSSGEFIGYVARGFELHSIPGENHSSRRFLSDLAESAGVKSRCPTVTSQFLLLLLDCGAGSIWETDKVLEERGFKMPVRSGAQIRGQEHIDHFALRLMLTDEEINEYFHSTSTPQKLAGDICLKSPNFTEPPRVDEVASSNEVWRQQLFKSSMHGKDGCASLIVMIGTLLSALAEWHVRHAGLLHAMSVQDVRESKSLAVANRRLTYLIWWLIQHGRSIFNNAVTFPQGLAYAAFAAISIKRLASSIYDSYTNSSAVLPKDLEATGPWQSIDTAQLSQKLTLLVSKWFQEIKAQILQQSMEKCRKYDSEKKYSAACFALLAWVALDHNDARSARAKGDDIYKRISEGIIKGNEIEWPSDLECKLQDGEHSFPAAVELALAFTACASWPKPGPGLLGSGDRSRYELVIHISHLCLIALASKQRGYSGDARLPVSSFVINYGNGCSNAGKPSAWESILAARLALMNYMLCHALDRDDILVKYKAKDVPRRASRELFAFSEKAWLGKTLANAEPYTRYSSNIFSKFVLPIVEQAKAHDRVLRPAQQGVSFILYGPPGSGKTHAVGAMASALGWPLLSLGPTNFITGGAEKIEENAATLFRDLMALDRCIVLFDECDELFRSRRDQPGTGRNSLSFATASMLPKLQALSKSRAVFFVLATNYLQNIDDAVRRDGRFDERLLLDRPHTKERLLFIKGIVGQKFYRVAQVAAKLDATVPAVRQLCDQSQKVQGLIALLGLRLTHGYSFTQVSDCMRRIFGEIEPLRRALGAEGSIDQIEENLVRTYKIITEKFITQDDVHQLDKVSGQVASMLAGLSASGGKPKAKELRAGAEAALILSSTAERVAQSAIARSASLDNSKQIIRLCDTWPVHDERQAFGSGKGIAKDNADEEELAKQGELIEEAFAIHSEMPPTAPSKQVSDYIEWIVSRADAELEAASVPPDVEVRLKTYWVSIPGYHLYLRAWLTRNMS